MDRTVLKLRDLSPNIRLLLSIFVVSILFSLLAFGAVHTFSFGMTLCLFSIGTLLVQPLSTSKAPQAHSTIVVILVSMMMFYIALQPYLLADVSTLELSKILIHCGSLLLFILAFSMSTSLLHSFEHGASFFKNILITVSTIVAIVALLHWFSDNGKLFWIFPPEHEVVSPRARWPFVNPNHLAHCLLPAIFLLSSELCVNTLRFLLKLSENFPMKSAELAQFLSRSSIQKALVKISVTLGLLLLCSTAFIGTLSRGAWLSGGICALIYVAAALKLLHSTHFKLDSSKKRRSRSSRVRESESALSPERTLRFALIPLSFIFLILLFVLFQGSTGDSVSDRMSYGLLAARDDMRIQLLKDTLPLIREHWLFGLGFDNWGNAHSAVMDPSLAGLNPVYLHSDPIQLFSEIGFVGIFPLLLLIACTLRKCVRQFRLLCRSQLQEKRERGWYLLGSSTGLLAFCIASFFDFPFRIPALVVLSACYLAFIYALAEPDKRA